MKNLLLLIGCCSLFSNPEAELIIIKNFLSPEITNTLIQTYRSQKPHLDNYSDNGISVGDIADPNVRKLFYDIVDRVLQVVKQKYSLSGKRVELDHGALYARIPPNSASYHNDNSYFDCPIHGKDQTILRMLCPGTCPGAKFVPNHTAWRSFTGLLYLNDNIEGGEIVFEDGPCNKIYKKLIKMETGMLVLSPNGPNFYHEVLPMKKGTRHSMHLWFTTDPQHFHTRR